ncbi:uncharacterized protein LOC107367046 [Tetranychus urticae]|uniref:Uncharacterized protein n=1 Tax=Tetranychus urticae TaxID=32264 RepID=T1KST2_TETUR|nr:uncharacterized protein LOC107367046 [Tetranychus urticae]
MKLSIVLIAIVFVSTISAAPIEEPSAYREAVTNLILSHVKLWESATPAWDAEASLESNVLAYVFGPTGPGWDPDLSTDKNVDKILNSLKIAEIDKSIAQNAANLVGDFMMDLPLPLFFPHVQIGKQIVKDICQKYFPGVHEHDTIGGEFEEWIDSHDDLKGLDGKEFIVKFLTKIFSHFNISDIGPNSTLEEIAGRFAELLFDTLYSFNELMNS